MSLDRQKQEEKRQLEETRAEGFKEKDRKRKIDVKIENSPKIKKCDETSTADDYTLSPRSEVKLKLNFKTKMLIFSYKLS